MSVVKSREKQMNSQGWSITDQCAADPSRPCELVSLGEFRDESGLVGEVTVEQCRKCGVGVSLPPIPDVAFLYADRSSQDFQATTGGISRLLKDIVFTLQGRRMVAQSGVRPARIIDFACGSGLLTSFVAEAAGPDCETIGADFHSEPPRDLRGLPYRSITNLDDLKGAADLVTAMHVVEHDDDSLRLLNSIVELARPGGKLLIEVPNVDCVWAPVFGKYWDAWYLPYHRVHFSRQSLRRLVEACGLEIEREYDVSIPTMGRTLANMMGKQNSTLFILISAALQPVQLLFEFVTRRPSALRIVARKPA